MFVSTEAASAADNLADQQYWDEYYRNLGVEVAPEDDILRLWLEKVVPRGTGTCLEIGCYPGRYLAVLGMLGYELWGIDLTPDVETKMPDFLKQNGWRVGEMIRGDFMTYEFPQQFDIVCSFGFIEHFTTWPEMLRRHAALVKPGGLLIVEAPNFRGVVQRPLHYFLDRANYDRHHIPAMNPYAWSRVVQREGLDILEKGHIGTFDFWIYEMPKGKRRQEMVKWIERKKPWLRQNLPAANRMYSPYAVMMAQRPK